MCGKSCQKCDDWPSAGPSPGVDTILSSIDHIVSDHNQHQYFTRLTARIKFKSGLRNSELERQTVESFLIRGVGSNRPQKYSLAQSWQQFSHGCVIMQMTTNVVSNLTSASSGKGPLEKQEIIRPPPLPSLPLLLLLLLSLLTGAEPSVSPSHNPNTFSSIIVWESQNSRDTANSPTSPSPGWLWEEFQQMVSFQFLPVSVSQCWVDSVTDRWDLRGEIGSSVCPAPAFTLQGYL